MCSEEFISNEQLAFMVKQKNDDAFKMLLSRFCKFILFKCNCYGANNAAIDVSELIQECEIALYKAAIDFKPELGFRFSTYYKSVMDITLKRAVKKIYVKQQRMIMPGEYDMSALNRMPLQNVREVPERYALSKELQKDLLDKINNCLSYKEKMCLILFMDGLSYEQISQKLNMTHKSVDGAMFRARRKLSKHVDIDEYLRLMITNK